MSLLEAVLLGAVQGLTEFLPVSSSGHLVLMQHLLGLKEPQVLFDVLVHLGTLGAVVVVYRSPLAALLRAALAAVTSADSWRRPAAAVAASPELRLLALLALASLPTALIGVLFKDALESLFAAPRVVAVMLAVTGLLLHAPRLRPAAAKRDRTPSAWHALLIGTAQGLAITPGISRSGSTISTALLCGIRPAAAAEFSFLLSIPAIVGAAALKLSEAGAMDRLPLGVVIAGVVVSFTAGWASLAFLIRVLHRGRFAAFSYYCFAVAALALLLLR